MRKSTLAAVAAVLLLIVAGAGWYAFSPGWTVRAMVEAARAGDEARFSSYVDYPALRDDMKAELTSRLHEEAAKEGSPQAKAAAAMGLALMGPLVDRMVSPEAMNRAFTKIAAEAPAAGRGAKTGKSDEEGQPEIRRQGLNRFIVAGKDMPDAGLVFERRGLSWKLAGIDLPPTRSPRA